MPKRILILRHSCFGDLIFGFKNLHDLQKLFNNNISIDWVCDLTYVNFLKCNPLISKVIGINRKEPMPKIDFEGYDLIFDGQNDSWSKKFLKNATQPIIKKPRYRLNKFFMIYTSLKSIQKPLIGMDSYQKPLEKYFQTSFINTNYIPNLNFEKVEINKDISESLSIFNSNFICLIQGASMELKRWPEKNWIELISTLNTKYNLNVIALGGPEDKINYLHPKFIDLSGKLNWEQSSYVLSKGKAFIGGDTGLTHLADYLKIPTICLRGGSAFGFCKNTTTKTIYKNLKCQPCSKNGRGKCKNKNYLQCLTQISSHEIISYLKPDLLI